ncbi:MAG: N-acetylmuramoyl-L-alanine amidase [Actinomycetota bacterium]|nr:N-acetylmuramoyl-L-alanine amidase [Actinomycetota bacterium]
MRRLLPVLLLVGLLAPAQAHAGNRLFEKSPNLDIARRVQALLLHAGVPVVMTRTSDRTTSLESRTTLANGRRVDAFISLHNNASPSRSANWSEVYHQLSGGGSRTLANMIRGRLATNLGQTAYLKTRRGDHGDYYWQLRHTSMPAVIVESAFISNRRQARLLATSAAYRQKIAQSVYEGIMAYQRTLRRASTPPEFAAETRVTVPAVPPPESVRGRAINSHIVRLTWTPVGGLVDGPVRVYRDGVPIGEAPLGQTVFEDVWAAPGQSYRYELRTAVKPSDLAASLESSPAVVGVRTPPIVVCLDPGHGGRDPGATGSY